MKKVLKKGLSAFLALIMVISLLPITTFAAVESSGRPKDDNNALILSIYTGDGFPGEPAVYGTGDYKNINSKFQVRSGATFASSAASQLNWDEINKDIVEGAHSGNTSVWGVYNTTGLEKYFEENASILTPKNEAAIIRSVKNIAKATSDDAILEQFEIIWYVIKLQHSSGWWGSTEWHIDGIIREKIDQTVAINYYGNGNTTGSAPLGVTNHPAGKEYTILGSDMTKKINGVEVGFLGWSTTPDGSGAFYPAGTVIKPEENISLYAMWDTTTQYTATVNTYLNDVLTDEDDIHGVPRDLYLSTDEVHYYPLTRTAEGQYSTRITGNGKFHLYNKVGETYFPVAGDRQLTIYNKDGHMDIHHYTVSYDLDGGRFETDIENPVYYYGNAADATQKVPVKDGYRFLGWTTAPDGTGTMIQPGEEVTSSITAPIVLYAQWEKTVTVTVNIKIDHTNHTGSDGGHDKTDGRENVAFTLVSRPDDYTPYLEVGETVHLSPKSHGNGSKFEGGETYTHYTGYTFENMPGGETDYTVVTSKSGYDIEKLEATQDADGNWTIDVEMKFQPSNFDLKFSVAVHENVPKQYLPTAAIVKVTFWSESDGWSTITQQEGDGPGVRVDIDPSTRSGSGSYPVWMNEADTQKPYGYRIEVTSFVYPDGTIVRASEITDDTAWSDNVYTATMDPVTGGQTYGTLDGAYYDSTAGENGEQKGTLHAVITMDLHDVTFDAQGGKVKGEEKTTVEQQYKIPGFKDYVPTREGGYTFAGWYEDKACTTPATEGKDLTENITLYAKWIEPLTISGTVTVAGTYKQDNKDVSVHDIDRATEAVVVLQEIRNGNPVEIASQTVKFGTYENSGSADYHFTGIPNNGQEYQIQVLELNYTTAYDNESDADSIFTDSEYKAVFNGDHTADVDAHLAFDPPSYTQNLKVDATQIGADYRPDTVLAEVLYRDTGDNHAYQRISQHNVAPYGVEIALTDGIGTGTQSIWNWHTNGTLYDYLMNISKVGDEAYDSDTAPYYILYSAANNANTPEVELTAELIPNQYTVFFDTNAEGDPVTGMDGYAVSENDEEKVLYKYPQPHTWSYDTPVTDLPAPQREGYIFNGWATTMSGVTENADGTFTIGAAVHQDVVLTAQWTKITYEVTAESDPTEGGTLTGTGTYAHGSNVTITATPAAGYTFEGWYENGKLFSPEEAYTFQILANHALTAKFTRNNYTVTAQPNHPEYGSTTGTGNYDEGTTATVTATANDGFVFVGWVDENSEFVSMDATYSFPVTADCTLTARFAYAHTITTLVTPDGAGTVTGGGTYPTGTEITIRAEANSGYIFIGWYDEKDTYYPESEIALTVMEDKTYTAKFEKKVSYRSDHVYIFGYEDTTIGAEGTLLRCELAQMIYRLVRQNGKDKTTGTVFEDTAGEWFQSGMAYMAQVGALDSTKTIARPYAPVTRGETYKMLCLGLGYTTDSTLRTSEYAKILASFGVDTPEGSVNSLIKRYEFCGLFNTILGRDHYLEKTLLDTAGKEVTADTYGYTDLDSSKSYYKTMLIATSTFTTDGRIDVAGRMERNTYDYAN